jgi:hypothetical protein
MGNNTPGQVYQTSSGGGAKIVNKFVERKNHDQTLESAAP